MDIRDVARRAADLTGGLQVPRRRRFGQGCPVLLANLHDIGTAPANTMGRKAHTQFAAQSVFAGDFDPIAEALWATDAGGVRSRIEELNAVAPFRVPGPLIVREVLSLPMAHSKIGGPIEVLDDPALLRRIVQRAIFTQLV